jgi:hypothetical protein
MVNLTNKIDQIVMQIVIREVIYKDNSKKLTKQNFSGLKLMQRLAIKWVRAVKRNTLFGCWMR